MNFLRLLFAFIVIPGTLFPQSTLRSFPERRMNVRKAANYYLKKKMDPSPRFSIQYSSLFSGLQHYSKRDTTIATKIIKRLYSFNDILFYRLMRIRLEWEFKQHLARASLDSIPALLKKQNEIIKMERSNNSREQPH